MTIYYTGNIAPYNPIFKDLEITAAKPKIRADMGLGVFGGFTEFYMGVTRASTGEVLVTPAYCQGHPGGDVPFTQDFPLDAGGNFTVGDIVRISFTKPPWYGNFPLYIRNMTLSLVD